ncbi:MAG TPA: ABC transporter permease, partial [Sediminibacterium sp.]|nr:ABC transporter permease [Sediminibacterium sp.]
MLRNYLKTAWRNLSANKMFTALNIAGLSVGLCVCITLFACISHELSFDRMYRNGKNIYRVNMQTTEPYNYQVWAELPNAVGPAMQQEIPQVQKMTRLIKHDFGASVSLRTGQKSFVEKGLYMADTAVFSMFDFQFIEGSAHTAFSQPKSIVLSMEAKKRLYGNEPAFGRIIYINNKDTLHVSGVYKDLPENSTIDCDMVYNIMDSWAGKNVYWSNASYETYCQLTPGSDIQHVQTLATGLIDKHVEKDNQYFTKFILQPLADIHLYSAGIRAGYSGRIGNITLVKALIFLSLLILLIACINYMNLATARSQKRAKGVGISKVLGASMRNLVLLFYTETAVLSLVAIIAGYLLALLAQPLFFRITGIQLESQAFFRQSVFAGLVIIWLIVTLVAGSYPSLSLSRISPLVLMKELKIKHSGADFIRKGLVLFQFTASVILIAGVIVIAQQMRYVRNKDLGYNPKGILAISIKAAQNKQQVAALTNDLKEMTTVESVSAVQSIPGDIESGRSVRKLVTDKNGYPVKTCHTDGGIVKTMQLQLLAGTTLPQTLAENDTGCYVLINEAVMKYLGYKTAQEAVGKYIGTEMLDKAIITGVVRDFNYKSLRDEIGGYVYYTMNKAPESLRTLLIRYNTSDL